jgi:O-antigen ligase
MRTLAYMLVWTYFFTVPWDHSLYSESLGPISRIVTLCSLPLVVVAIAVGGHVRRIKLVHVFMLLFFLLIEATFFWTLDSDATLTAIRAYMQIMIVAWLVWEFAPDDNSLRKLAFAYMLGGYVSIVNTFRDFATSTLNSVERFSADGWNQNDLALALALGILMARYASIGGSKVVRLLAFAYIPLALVAVALTGSRGGSIVAAIAVLGVAVQWKGKLSVKLVSLAIFLIAICVGLSFVPEHTADRILNMGSNGIDFGNRVPIWQIALREFPAHPVLGVGASAFSTATNTDSVAHNTFLSVLVEEGLLGLGIFVAILVLLFRSAWKTAPPVRMLCVMILLCWVTGVCSLTWEQSRVTWVIFALIAAQPEVGIMGKLEWGTCVHARNRAFA